MRIRLRMSAARTMLVAIAATFMLIAGLSTALAVPVEPTLGLDALQVKLDASPDGVVHGYFKTVLKGSTVETISVDVLAITSDDSGEPNDTSSLILISSTDTKLDAIGGIASGMSGSPIYVEDGGLDKLIGAVSYGDIFTKSGTGLATPIDAMSAVEDFGSVADVQYLKSPVVTDVGILTRIVIASDAAGAVGFADKHTLVAKPFASLTVGGLSPNSRGYRAMKALVEKRGYQLLPLGAALGSGVSDFSTPFVPGASVAALISRGSYWTGGIGTTTYVNGNSVLAFGHPLIWDGASGYELANAWVDGVWPSTYDPYKIVRPGALRGTVTQDRGAGIKGQLGLMPAEASITAHVLDRASGRTSSGTTYMPRTLLNGVDWGLVPPMAVYSTALRACDDHAYSGSALTTTTIVVGDGVSTYTLTRANIWDDSADVAFGMVEDVASMVADLKQVSANGLAHADILSVDFAATMNPARSTAHVVDVKAPQGLKWGANALKVSLVQYGVAATKTIDVNLTIPTGTPLTGTLSVGAPLGGPTSDEGMLSESAYNDIDRRSVKQAVADIRAVPLNSDILVTFTPVDTTTDKELASIETKKATSWYITGNVEKTATKIVANADPNPASYHDDVELTGMVEGSEVSGYVKIYGRLPGQTTDTLLRTARTSAEESPWAMFDTTLYDMRRNMTVTIVYEGSSSALASRTSFNLKVKAGLNLTTSASSVKLGHSVRLTAVVGPSATTGFVEFQRYGSGRWVTIATKRIVGGSATCSVLPHKGTTYLRVRYVGGIMNAASTSTMKRVTAK